MIYEDSIDPIPRDELHAMVLEYQQTKDLDVADRVIRSLLPLIRGVAQQYTKRLEDLDDYGAIASAAVLRSMETWEPGGGANFITYSKRQINWDIIGNKTVKQVKNLKIMVDGGGDNFENVVFEQEQFFNAKEIALLIESIKKLDQRRMTVIIGYYYAGMTYGEIATKLNVSKQRVGQLRKAALVALRRDMEKYLDL